LIASSESAREQRGKVHIYHPSIIINRPSSRSNPPAHPSIPCPSSQQLLSVSSKTCKRNDVFPRPSRPGRPGPVPQRACLPTLKHPKTTPTTALETKEAGRKKRARKPHVIEKPISQHRHQRKGKRRGNERKCNCKRPLESAGQSLIASRQGSAR
jgi:hypothetical protein